MTKLFFALSAEFLSIRPIGLYHPLDCVINPKYKLLHFLTTIFFYKEKKALAFNWDRCCHLALCLQLILFNFWNMEQELAYFEG